MERIGAEHFEMTTALTRVVSQLAAGDKIEGLDNVTELPVLVLSCMSALLHHLVEFGLSRAVRLDRYVFKMVDSFLTNSTLSAPLYCSLHHLSFGSDVVCLDPSTIRNLDLFSNAEGSVQGTFFWALNHTATKFGAR